MATFLYFAYGSNMLSSRLRARCPSAVFRTTAIAHDYAVAFGKPSVDRSGKATLRPMVDQSARGVVFEIANEEAEKLDSAEGLGYKREEAFRVVCTRSNEIMRTRTYFAKEHDDRLRPYDWYMALILAGLEEHGLSDGYASVLGAVDWTRDTDLERKTRREAVLALEQMGIVDYTRLLTNLSVESLKEGGPARLSS